VVGISRSDTDSDTATGSDSHSGCSNRLDLVT